MPAVAPAMSHEVPVGVRLSASPTTTSPSTMIVNSPNRSESQFGYVLDWSFNN